MNITDVDDKTIAGALKEGVTLKEYTDNYTQIFFEDCKTLNIEPVEHYPRATESIDAMIDIIAHLDKKGLVYEKDGSLYFQHAKFHKYGRLSMSPAWISNQAHDMMLMNIPRRMFVTLHCGKLLKKMSYTGKPPLAKADLGGILNARLWCAKFLAPPLTYIPVV
jgi:hypothetical protein